MAFYCSHRWLKVMEMLLLCLSQSLPFWPGLNIHDEMLLFVILLVSLLTRTIFSALIRPNVVRSMLFFLCVNCPFFFLLLHMLTALYPYRFEFQSDALTLLSAQAVGWWLKLHILWTRFCTWIEMTIMEESQVHSILFRSSNAQFC